jgi:deoxyribose-phosphate aldolase
MNKLAALIDHTNLKPDARKRDIERLCREALDWGFASVCVNSCNVALAAELLRGSEVKVCSVVGFPLGAAATEIKAAEAAFAHKNGASEIDMVINVGWLKDGLTDFAEQDIRAVVTAVPACTVKVIIETCLLTDDEKAEACRIIKSAGAHFVKTSTGFSKAGADVRDVMLLKREVGWGTGIKASGGIRDYDSAMVMLGAGATRLGTSNSVAICEEAIERLNSKYR